MKIGLAISLLIVIAFLIGRGSKQDVVESGDHHAQNQQVSRTRDTKNPSSRRQGSIGEDARATLERGGNLTSEQCRALTSEERIEMLQRGALIYDDIKQADYLMGLISTLNAEEFAAARKYLGRAQSRGNISATSVWDALWKQAGRVAPLETLGDFGKYKSRKDARRVMEGWYETHPAAALAWAQNPPESDEIHYIQTAAYALTLGADGDSEKLLQTLTETKLHESVSREILLDYFDLVEVSGGSGGAAAVYDELPASLKPDAWAVALQRISYTDKEQALEWLADHAGDAGSDYGRTTRLIGEMAEKDPAKMTIWAAELPASSSDGIHPVEVTFGQWKRQDPAAAEAWLNSVPANTSWAKRLSN
ncbi:hypothetical protein V2O64_16360 [Verrucomicrobiaceae bacterium 227]